MKVHLHERVPNTTAGMLSLTVYVGSTRQIVNEIHPKKFFPHMTLVIFTSEQIASNSS
jgi:hypothetical protein